MVVVMAADHARNRTKQQQPVKGRKHPLKRLQPNLASIGLAVEHGRVAHRRTIRLEWVGESPSSPSSPSPTPDDQGKRDDGGHRQRRHRAAGRVIADDVPDDDDDGVDHGDGPSPSPPQTRPGQRKRRRRDADDADDAPSRTRSSSGRPTRRR
jgi:hypothetical protein